MESNLLREIDSERKEREENEESFMNLLEDTCNRIERTIEVWLYDLTIFKEININLTH